MSLSKTLYPLFNTGSIQKNLSRHDGKIDIWDIKDQNKHNYAMLCFVVFFVVLNMLNEYVFIKKIIYLFPVFVN